MLLVKEELQVKKLRGINVLPEVGSSLNIFFTEKKELKKSIPNSEPFQLTKIMDGVMIQIQNFIINLLNFLSKKVQKDYILGRMCTI